MTRLDCSVVNCTYNKDNSCCKDNIHVGGRNAKVTDQTCCDSFRERKYDGARNADDIPQTDGGFLRCDHLQPQPVLQMSCRADSGGRCECLRVRPDRVYDFSL